MTERRPWCGKGLKRHTTDRSISTQGGSAMTCIRAKVLGSLALVILVAGVMAGPATAGGPAIDDAKEAAPATSPFNVQPLVKSDCPAGKVCFWSGNTYGGQQAFFPEVKGCYGLANIDPHSVYNHMYGSYVRILETPQYYEWILWQGESASNTNITGGMCISHL